MKVENMAMNQFIIYLDNCTAFQSYDILIAVAKDGIIYVCDKWDYSKTTLKYFKKFIRRDWSKAELTKVISSSEYFTLVTEDELHEMIKCQNV
jgi:hypothetical protein